MKKAVIFINLALVIGLSTIFGMSYFAVTHPILSIGAAFLGVNILVFSLIKLI